MRHDTATGRRDVLVGAAQLTPPSLGKPLQFGDYTLTADGRRVIVAASGRPAMIWKTAYDYWCLERVTGEWRRLYLGSEGAPTASDSGCFVNSRAAGERRPV